MLCCPCSGAKNVAANTVLQTATITIATIGATVESGEERMMMISLYLLIAQA